MFGEVKRKEVKFSVPEQVSYELGRNLLIDSNREAGFKAMV